VTRTISYTWGAPSKIKRAEMLESGNWDVHLNDSTCFIVAAENIPAGTTPPKVGDYIELKTSGSSVAGVRLNGVDLYDHDDCEMHLQHIEWCRNKDLRNIADFRKARADLDARYRRLPDCFRKRIDKFRRNNPDFRWRFESYEMLVCDDAVRMADALKTPAEVERFRDLDYKEQRRLVPGLDEGHSGNSFYCALRLAHLYVSNRLDEVEKMYGALAPLVGSEEYGCVPRTEK
jgi:hypothetical protein